MGARVIWSPEAADDLEQIVQFIARDSPRYGRQVASEVLEAIEGVSRSPRSGPVVTEFNDPDIRQVRAYSYRVIYRVADEVVHVAAIVHGARDLHKAVADRTI
jgi:toxin ParE1/3/4